MAKERRKTVTALWLIVVIFLLLGWGGGLWFRFGGAVIHVLLFLAALVVTFRLIDRRPRP